MAITASYVTAGPALVTLGSLDLGGTVGPVTIEYGRGIKIIKVSDLPGAFTVIQTGEGQEVHVKGKLTATNDATVIKALWKETTKAGETLTMGRVPGHAMDDYAEALTIHPIRQGATVTSDWHVPRAINIASSAFSFDGDNPIELEFDFVALADESESDGAYLADMGVTSDTTAPELTSIVPADNASSQLGTVNIVIVFNEAMAKSSLVNDSGISTCATVYDETNDGFVACAAAVSTTTNANDTLTLNPDATLTASATIRITLGEAAQDLNGNAFAGAVYEFGVTA